MFSITFLFLIYSFIDVVVSIRTTSKVPEFQLTPGRQHMCAVGINDLNGLPFVVVAGGEIHNATDKTEYIPLDEMIVFDVEQKTQTKYKLSVARDEPHCMAIGDLVLIGGGKTNIGFTPDALDTVDIFNITSREFLPVKKFTRGGGVNPITSCSKRVCAIIGGGSDVDNRQNLELFDLKTKNWRSMELKILRNDNGAAANIGDKFYVVGGDFGAPTVEVIDTTSDTPLDWSTGLLNNNLTHGWRGIAAARSGDTLVFAGGRREKRDNGPTPSGQKCLLRTPSGSFEESEFGGLSWTGDAPYYMTAATLGQYALFIGGQSGSFANAKSDGSRTLFTFLEANVEDEAKGWTRNEDTALPVKVMRHGVAAVIYKNRGHLFVIGGRPDDDTDAHGDVYQITYEDDPNVVPQCDECAFECVAPDRCVDTSSTVVTPGDTTTTTTRGGIVESTTVVDNQQGSADESSGGGSGALIAVLIVVGVLLLIGIAVLAYFLTKGKKEEEKNTEVGNYALTYQEGSVEVHGTPSTLANYLPEPETSELARNKPLY